MPVKYRTHLQKALVGAHEAGNVGMAYVLENAHERWWFSPSTDSYYGASIRLSFVPSLGGREEPYAAGYWRSVYLPR